MVEKRSYEVQGMSCGGCEQAVENAVKNVEGVRRVDAAHDTGTLDVTVEPTVSNDELEGAIHDAGYDVVA